MTEEEINALQETVTTLQAQVSDLTAERDSLSEENAALRAERDTSVAELQETKKLNYTLARQIDSRPKASFGETLLKAMGVNE